MVALTYGKSAYRRDKGNLPELRLRNMFVEAAPTAEGGITLQDRPGLKADVSRGAGPVLALRQQPGLFAGKVIAVSGNAVYVGADNLGSVSGTGPASMALSASEAVATRGGRLVRTNGTAVITPPFPDDASVTAVAFLAGLFIAARAGTHRFYWSGVLNATSWDALDFASAESEPDELLDIVNVGPELAMLGSRTVEFWQPSGDADIPFIRAEGRIYRKGVKATGSALELDNTLFWIGHDNIVYRGAQVPERVSDHGIEERIGASQTHSAFKLEWQGHAFFCIRLDRHTFAYDVATGGWCEFASYGQVNFQVRSAVAVDGQPVLGSADSGDLYRLSGYEDEDGPLERLFTAAFPLTGGSVPIDNLWLSTNVGQTDALGGEGADPSAEIRTSRDAGMTWGDWRPATMGRQGEYRRRTQWRRLGTFDYPGAMFEFRCTDPVPFRVSGVAVNEPGGGRSR